MEPEHVFTLTQLLPYFTKYGAQYGIDHRVVAAVAFQESGFRNYRVHNDGTGHGLFGLDDGGMRVPFEQWSGFFIGPGRTANIAPPEKQIEYASYQLKRYADAYGNHWAACRAWHRGGGLLNDARGQQYEALIKAHVARLFP